MTGIEGVDALGHPDPKATAAAGKKFVGQYLKNITRDIIDAYHAEGVAVVLLDEASGRDALNGYAEGVARGKAANVKLTALGAPAGVASIAAETDFQPTSAQMPTVVQFYLGYAAGIGSRYRAGAYGDYDVMVALRGAGFKGILFQTYAWSHGQWAQGDAIQQYLNGQSLAGTAVDYDRALVSDYGAWAPAHALGLPAPVVYPGKPVGWSTVNPQALVYIQRCLCSAGYRVPISGKFDSATRNAVAKYQLRHPWAFAKDQPCGPGAIKRNVWASLATYYGK